MVWYYMWNFWILCSYGSEADPGEGGSGDLDPPTVTVCSGPGAWPLNANWSRASVGIWLLMSLLKIYDNDWNWNFGILKNVLSTKMHQNVNIWQKLLWCTHIILCRAYAQDSKTEIGIKIGWIEAEILAKTYWALVRPIEYICWNNNAWL